MKTTRDERFDEFWEVPVQLVEQASDDIPVAIYSSTIVIEAPGAAEARETAKAAVWAHIGEARQLEGSEREAQLRLKRAAEYRANPDEHLFEGECVYCGEDLALADRLAIVPSLGMDAAHLGNFYAHAACQERAVWIGKPSNAV